MRMTITEKRATLEKLKRLPAPMRAELERRETELVRRGADDDELDGLHRLYAKQVDLLGL